MSPLVGVLGAAHAPPDSVVYTDAVTVGRLLAEAGVCTICGGLGGVMEAVARGVREADGTCIGPVPDPASATPTSPPRSRPASGKPVTP
jgi:uncharacterized protein (TIGR00725 family)